jgi:hypothetical protein
MPWNASLAPVATRSMTPLTLPRLFQTTRTMKLALLARLIHVSSGLSLRVGVCKDRARSHEKFMHAASGAGVPETTL